MSRRPGLDPVDAAIEALGPLVARSQLNRAVEYLRAHFETQMALGGPQAGRAVLEKVYLVCGDRRYKCLNVDFDRRGK